MILDDENAELMYSRLNTLVNEINSLGVKFNGWGLLNGLLEYQLIQLGPLGELHGQSCG